jgi:shikimate dehydrogenase
MGVPYAELIGDPVAHSKSPLIHNFWLRKLGLEGEYRAVRVEAGGLAEYFAARRGDPLWRGCNVTMPHKLAVIDAVDHLERQVQRIGAVNTVVPYDGLLMGINTDWYGLNLALPFGAAADKDVILIGAGGAARGAMGELRQAGPRALTILNRDRAKAAALLADFEMAGEAHGLDAPLPPADLLINASALGMAGFPPLDLGLSPLRESALVMDMVYDPVETPLLRAARARGLVTVDGLSMLIWQASMAFQFFFKSGVEEPDTAELRALLAP